MAKEVEKEIKKVGIGLVLSWIFSFLAIIAGVVDMSYSFAGGLFIILAGIIISPVFCSFIKKKFKVELTGWLKFLIFIILFIIGGILISNSLAYKTITGNGIVNSIESQTEQKSEIQSTCTPNWQCYEWSACMTNGIQTRTCFDSNNCQTSSGKPKESQSCTPQTQATSAWHNVTYFSGKGNKNTDSFFIKGDKVKITARTWNSYGFGSYSAVDLKKDNKAYIGTGLSISTQGSEDGNGETIYRNLKSGDYYISVISGIDWEVNVEEYY